MKEYVIGIDIGTSGTKTVLWNVRGQAISSATVEYPMAQPQNGWAEQDPADWHRATVETIRKVMRDSGVDPHAVAGIGLSGQMHGLVMLDERDRVLRPAILWCDQRTGAECAEIEREIGRDRCVAITANPVLTGFTAGKIRWVRKHEPEIFRKCRRILLPKDYVRLLLTGEYATEVSDASGMQLLDVPKRAWSDVMCDALAISSDMLGRVYESPDVTGVLTESAAAACGLVAGIPVVGGAGDNAAAAVGMGVVTEGAAFTTIGTSGVVFAHTDRPVIDPAGRVHTFCCAVPGAWHVMGVTQGAGLSLRWFRDTLCSPADFDGADPYTWMTAQAEKSPVLANRLFYLPYLMGERTPHLDPDARGVFFGLSGIHQKGDMIRSVLEGVAFSLTDCLTVLHEMKVRLDTMRICGGGGKSALWRQILADCYRMPVCRMENEEGPALGVGILAMVGGGLYPDVVTACREIVRERDRTDVSENAARYGMGYALYRRLYPALRNEFAALAAL